MSRTRFSTFIELRGATIIEGSNEPELKLVNTPKEAAELIYRDCQPYLEAIKGDVLKERRQLLRGMNYDVAFDRLETRANRRPVDMSAKVHTLLDAFFEQRFGIPYRSQGTFATGSPLEAMSYGTVYLMFPRGKFDFVWSPIVHDAFGFFDGFKNGDDPSVLNKFADYFSLHDIVTIDDRDERLEAMANYHVELRAALKSEDFEYRSHDLPRAIASGNEIMVDCESYYIVHLNEKSRIWREQSSAADEILKHLANLIDG